MQKQLLSRCGKNPIHLFIPLALAAAFLNLRLSATSVAGVATRGAQKMSRRETLYVAMPNRTIEQRAEDEGQQNF